MTQPIVAIAFDWGSKWIGCAVGQSISGTATALSALRARDGQPDWQQLQKLLDEWQPQYLVVGQPLNMDGSESAITQRATKFARRLEGRFGLPVALHDERLSSFEAKGELLQAGQREFRDAGVDSRSAALILESWLREREGINAGG